MARGGRKTRRFYIYLTPEEYAEWEAHAKEHGLSTSEWVRRRCRVGGGRFGRSRKPAEPRCEHGIVESLPCRLCDAQLDRQAAETERIAERTRQAGERRIEAGRLARAAGGAERWYAAMRSQDHERSDDLRNTLIDAERLEREAAESWAKFTGTSPQSYEAPRPQWRPPSSLTGERPPSLGPAG